MNKNKKHPKIRIVAYCVLFFAFSACSAFLFAAAAAAAVSGVLALPE